MQTWLFATAVAVLVFSGAVAAEQLELAFKAPVPIAYEEMPALFEQCSRDAPQTDGRFWQPTEAAIARLEKQLRDHVAENPDVFQIDQRSNARAFRRQYAGFYRGGSEFIYGSFTAVRDDGFDSDIDEFGPPIVVCDGGPDYWGVVYDVERETFGEFRFNGYR